MLRALRAETLKLKRSLMPLWTALAVLTCPLLVLVPTLTAENSPRPDWVTFMRSGTQIVAVYGVVLFGLVTAYVFGREYTEGSATVLLTLPVRREWFLLAKGVVLAGWLLGLTVLALVAQAGYAALLGLRGFAWQGAVSVGADAFAVTALIFGTLPIVALVTMVGRGYMAPMIYSAVVAAAGLGLAEVGLGRWFPWAMPISVTGILLGPPLPVEPLVPGSWALMACLFLSGTGVLVWYFTNADNTL